jgi:hypothetical protein
MSYNPNIPQPTDNISVSQGQILTNFTQLNQVFTFNSSTTGATGGTLGVKLTNGLIINFSSSLVAFTSGGTLFTFQTTYPYTTTYAVVAIPEGASATSVGLSVVKTSLTQFTGYSSNASANCYWIAIGY